MISSARSTKSGIQGDRRSQASLRVKPGVRLPLISSARGISNAEGSTQASQYGGAFVGGLQSSPSTYILTPQLAQLIFVDHTGAQSEVREDCKQLCDQVGIDWATLYQRELKDFASEGVQSKIQEVRFNHYNARRVRNLEMIENAIMSNGQIGAGSTISSARG